MRRFNEIHGYLWYDAAWLSELGFDPGACVELRNPAAAGLHQLRQTLLPGLLAALVRNRFHFDELSLLELGGVFEQTEPEDREYRHLGLIRAVRQKRADDKVYHELKPAWRAGRGSASGERSRSPRPRSGRRIPGSNRNAPRR